jgi:hypothetical protein
MQIIKEKSIQKRYKKGSIDSLIPIIEAIQEISDDTDQYLDGHYNIMFTVDLLHGVTIKVDKERIFLCTAFGEGQLADALYEGCLSFADWFEKHKK